MSESELQRAFESKVSEIDESIVKANGELSQAAIIVLKELPPPVPKLQTLHSVDLSDTTPREKPKIEFNLQSEQLKPLPIVESFLDTPCLTKTLTGGWTRL